MAPTPEHLSTPETASFWAKTGDKESPTRGLSLVQHMFDAGSVAARLWDTWLAPGLQKRFSEHLHLSMQDTRALVCWLAATRHGQSNPRILRTARCTTRRKPRRVPSAYRAAGL